MADMLDQAIQMDWKRRNARQARDAKFNTPVPQKTKGRGGFITSLISEGGATGGAVSGAATGAALGSVVPGIGTAIGGIVGGGIGGFLGGTGGRLVENKVRDDEFNVGSALKEGAISGVVAGRPIKLAKALPGIAKGLAGKEVAETTAAKSSGGFLKNMTTQGQQMQARGLGISGGNKAAGKELQPQDTERLLKVLKNEKIPVRNANSTARDLNDRMKDYGGQIKAHFDDNPVTYNAAAKRQIGDKFIAALKTSDPRVLKEARILVRDLNKNVKTNKDLWTFRKELDNRIPDTKQVTGVTLSNQMKAIKSFRQTIAKELGDVPGMKNYSDLAEVKQFIGKGMRELNQPSGGIAGRLLSSGPIQKAEAIAGKGLEGVGQIGSRGAAGAAADIPSAKNFAARIIAGRGVDNLTSPNKDVQDAFALEDGSEDLSAAAGDDLNAGVDEEALQQEDTSNDPYAPENIQRSIQAIVQQGGKQKDIAEFLSNAKIIGDLTATKKEKPLSAEASKVVSNAQTGINALKDFNRLITENPTGFGKTSIPGVGVLDRLSGGRASGALGTSEIDAARDQVIDVIARLRTGAAISKEEASRFERYVPRPGDTPAAKAQKLKYLMDQFQFVAERSGGAGTDLQSSVDDF